MFFLLKKSYSNKGRSRETIIVRVNHNFINPQLKNMCALISPNISSFLGCQSSLRKVNTAVGTNLRQELMALKNSLSLKLWNQKKSYICLYAPERIPHVPFWKPSCLTTYKGSLKYSLQVIVTNRTICTILIFTVCTVSFCIEFLA